MRGCWSRLHKMMPEAEAQTMRAQAWLWFRGRAQTSRRQTDEAARLRAALFGGRRRTENKRRLARGRECNAPWPPGSEHILERCRSRELLRGGLDGDKRG